MSENFSDITAARGRIIKRGGLKSSCASVRRTLPSDRGLVKPGNTSQIGRLKDPITIFLIVPAIFCASALLTWSRPFLAHEVSAAVTEAPVYARFHDIGNELAGRFSTTSTGTVIERAKSTHAALAVPAVVAVSPVRVKAPPGNPPHARRDALEKQVYKILKKHGQPVKNGKELAASIVTEALAQDYDPMFVAAVIKSESAFNALARSHKGAQGLMQIMPKTGAWLAQQQDLPRRKLTDPGHNLKLGISYLKQLEAGYKGNRMLTLVAYNWGPGHVESASAGSRRVPGEVMQYAVKILNDYRRWSSELRSSIG